MARPDISSSQFVVLNSYPGNLKLNCILRIKHGSVCNLHSYSILNWIHFHSFPLQVIIILD